METKKVRRTIHFNDAEKFNRFRMLYGDLFQTLNNFNGKGYECYGSSMKGYEYEFNFHMSKENFDMLKKEKVVKKISRAPYKDNWMKGYKKDIWVLC